MSFSLKSSAAANLPGVTEVQMVKSGGTYAVPVLINNAITLDFVLDSGASDVSIPSDVFSTLVRAGTITKEDIIGSDTYTLADGSQKKSTTFRIRSLKIGPTILENVKGSVAEDSSPLLLGMSFLSRFKSWSVDNEKHILVLK
jgi:clan AA aspartic protease (TIGR02281 family)